MPRVASPDLRARRQHFSGQSRPSVRDLGRTRSELIQKPAEIRFRMSAPGQNSSVPSRLRLRRIRAVQPQGQSAPQASKRTHPASGDRRKRANARAASPLPPGRIPRASSHRRHPPWHAVRRSAIVQPLGQRSTLSRLRPCRPNPPVRPANASNRPLVLRSPSAARSGGSSRRLSYAVNARANPLINDGRLG